MKKLLTGAICAALWLSASPAHAADENVCRKLHSDYIFNELLLASSYGLYEKQYNLSQSADVRSRMDRYRAEMRRVETEHQLKGDRIVALMTGHGCKPPDHVTSPHTYKMKLEQCEATGVVDCDTPLREAELKRLGF